MSLFAKSSARASNCSSASLSSVYRLEESMEDRMEDSFCPIKGGCVGVGTFLLVLVVVVEEEEVLVFVLVLLVMEEALCCVSSDDSEVVGMGVGLGGGWYDDCV